MYRCISCKKKKINKFFFRDIYIYIFFKYRLMFSEFEKFTRLMVFEMVWHNAPCFTSAVQYVRLCVTHLRHVECRK